MLRTGALLWCLALAWATSASAQQGPQTDRRVAELVQSGKLRIGVFPSFQYSKDQATGQPRGLAIRAGSGNLDRRIGGVSA